MYSPPKQSKTLPTKHVETVIDIGHESVRAPISVTSFPVRSYEIVLGMGIQMRKGWHSSNSDESLRKQLEVHFSTLLLLLFNLGYERVLVSRMALST